MTKLVEILSADDNEINRSMIEAILEGKNYIITSVSNGKEAVDMILSGKKYDIILMDIQMPEMNGLDATKKLRNLGVKTPILGVSAGSSNDECKDVGMDDFIKKPYRVDELIGKILELINK